MDKKKSCGFVALLGEPNAGKSTLLNFMVGAKVSIVTHKVQTTRTRIRGVSILGDSQIIFVDTPGLFRPRRRLDRAMVKAAWTGALDADIIVFLIEANRGITDGVRENLKKLKDFDSLKFDFTRSKTKSTEPCLLKVKLSTYGIGSISMEYNWNKKGTNLQNTVGF